MMMTTAEAIRQLRCDPRHAGLIRDAYLGLDVIDSGERFAASPEFTEVKHLLEGRIQGATIVDLGAGTGIGSYALAKSGAKVVYALEPDESDEIGRGAIRRLAAGLPIELLDAQGENITLADGSVDVVYIRQALHHARDLLRLVSECGRILRSGGALLACREPVVDNAQQLEKFLQAHPVHRLAGGEHAYSLPTYLDAIRLAGLELNHVLGPWDTLINAFPSARSRAELEHLPQVVLSSRLGRLGTLAGQMPGVKRLIWRLLRRPVAGRNYTFGALKP